jgi:hypothetical protein
VDSPDSHELRGLLFDTAHQYFGGNPFRRDALISLVQRRGRSLGWWLTEPDHSLPGKKRGAKGSAATIEEAFSHLVQRGVVIQVKEDCWSLRVSKLENET